MWLVLDHMSIKIEFILIIKCTNNECNINLKKKYIYKVLITKQ